MKLNGYTLKAVKTMETLDGCAYSGNIYFGGKKIGMACNNGCGGMTDVHLMPGIPDLAAHNAALTEDLVERLFTLHDYEKIFKAETKNHPDKGIACVTYSKPFDFVVYACSQDTTADDLTAWLNEEKPGWEIGSIEVFHSLDDFNIDEPQQQEMADGGQDFASGQGEDAGGMTMKM